MQFHRYEITFSIFAFGLVAIEWYMYWRFEKALSLPFKKININERELYLDYKITDTLYQSYKKLPPGKFKIVKMSVKSRDVENSPLHQIIDVFTKLVLTIILAVMGVSVTISVALLGFLNDNAELKDDYHTWVRSVQDILTTFIEGSNAFLSIIFIGIVLCSVSINHIVLSHRKKDLYKRHLTIINEIEKELL